MASPPRTRDSAPRLAGTLHLAQAQSNRGPGGWKKDFPDAERSLALRLPERDKFMRIRKPAEATAASQCLATLTFVSWNPIGQWLRRVNALRLTA